MNIGIRRVGLAIIVLFIALVAQLTYLQVVDSKQARQRPAQRRASSSRTSASRAARSSPPTASSSPSRYPTNDEFRYQRVYPAATAKLFAQVVGYQSIQFGSVGVGSASTRRSSRAATSASQSQNLRQHLRRTQPVTGTVVLTLSAKAQAAAAAALGGQRGIVVVLDVQTGGVVAMYSNPTFDPNPLATHDTKKAQTRVRVPASPRPTNRCSPARGASSTRPARRSRP